MLYAIGLVLEAFLRRSGCTYWVMKCGSDMNKCYVIEIWRSGDPRILASPGVHAGHWVDPIWGSEKAGGGTGVLEKCCLYACLVQYGQTASAEAIAILITVESCHIPCDCCTMHLTQTHCSVSLFRFFSKTDDMWFVEKVRRVPMEMWSKVVEVIGGLVP